MPATIPAHSDVESVVSMSILNPETRCASRTFEFWGVVDDISGGTVIDYKSVDNPQRFIHQRRIGLQGEKYALAKRAEGVTIDAIEYRLVQRPGIKYIQPRYKWAVVKAGRKSAVRVCDTEEEADTEAKLRGCGVEKRTTGYETREEYENKCLEWIQDNPAKLVTHTHLLTSARLEQAEHRLWESTKRILDNRRTNRWLANESACFTWNNECEDLPLCECVMNGGDLDWVIADQYDEVDDLHPELGGVERSKDVLTYTSCSMLHLCEVRYYWLYERGLRRRHDDSEALWLGSAMHRGLEAHAKGGPVEAFEAIDRWAEASPIIGADQAWFQDQQIAKARAMVRAAAMKWPVGGSPDA